ncbi:MAG TPA: ATP-binding cassette domain-containing protein [Chitinophagaceae bacterium]|nr:ATP-binding cassette domain-containing protein [Chitinophagaceae bacterium]
MENILSVQHLKKYYAAHKAVDDISFDITKGNIFGLLGPNGAGKTTLLRMVTGIFYPDEGQILLNGKPFNAARDISLIGYMPEERGLYKKMLVGEQILYLAQLKGMRLSEARSKAMFWIKRFDLQDWWSRKVGDLSKGMQQKVQFISTILHEPPLLILDEPFSGLDPINTNVIKDEIFELSEKGTTIIFSTHRMEQVEEICRHIVLVDQGKKILDGTVDKIKHDFKKNEFSITLAEAPEERLEQDNEIFLVEAVNQNTVVIKLKAGKSNNDALQYFMGRGHTINAFHEILPSINQVFIEQVEKTAPLKTTAQPAA